VKVCTRCGLSFPATAEYFYGRRAVCKTCCNALGKAQRMTPRGKDFEFRSRYGIRYDDYQNMYKAQAGKCAICGEVAKHTLDDARKSDKLVVDHCHATGAVRSLLCAECNKGLGKFKDNPRLLMQAAGYIQHHRNT
jgi:hypothetical protein